MKILSKEGINKEGSNDLLPFFIDFSVTMLSVVNN